MNKFKEKFQIAFDLLVVLAVIGIFTVIGAVVLELAKFLTALLGW